MMENKLEIFPIGSMLSIPILIATLCMHVRVSELNKYHRKYIISYLIALTVAISTSCFGYFTRAGMQTYLVILMNLSSLSTFFWLNVICYDLCIQIRELNRTAEQFRKYSERTRFILYSVFAWGLPLVLHATIPFVGYALSAPRSFYRQTMERFMFFSLPMVFVFAFNIVFKHKYLSALRKYNETKEIIKGIRNDEKVDEETIEKTYLFKFHFYLFVGMGVAWIVDAFLVFVLFITDMSDSDRFFLPIDISNIVQGVLMFVWTMSQPIIKDLRKLKYNRGFQFNMQFSFQPPNAPSAPNEPNAPHEIITMEKI